MIEDQMFAEEKTQPSDDEMFESGQDACIPVIEEYTGEPFDTSPFVPFVVVPSRDSWDSDGDRGLVCIALALAGEHVVELRRSFKAGATGSPSQRDDS